jgi:hypothetical protein
MNKRIILLAALLCCLFASSMHSARSQGPVDAAAEAAPFIKLSQFLQSITGPAINPLIVSTDKDRLTRAVNDLGNSFEHMVLEKRTIAAFLKTTPPNVPVIRLAAQQLEKDINRTVKRLKENSFNLKKQYQEQGGAVARELENTLLTRKSWVLQIIALCFSVCEAEPDQIASWADAADKSANALDQANVELAKLIVKAPPPQ